MSRAGRRVHQISELMNSFGKSGFIIRFDCEQADSHPGAHDGSPSRCQPIAVEFLENDGRMIVSQARFRDAGAAWAFGAVPHPVTRSAGRPIGPGQNSAVQAKCRNGDRRESSGGSGIAEVGLDRPDVVRGVVADRRQEDGLKPEPVAISPISA